MWFPAADVTANRGSALLVLAWREFFDPATPPIFRPRVHHLKSLLGELREVAARAVEDGVWTSHLKHVQAEVADVASSDVVLASLPRVRQSVLRVLKTERPRTLCAELAVVLDELDYSTELRQAARDHVAAPDVETKKERTLDLLAVLATETRRAGCAPHSCSALFAEDALTRGLSTNLEAILALADRAESEWTVEATLRSAADSGYLRALFAQTEIKRAPSPSGSDDFVAQTTVVARGPDQAAAAFVRRVQQVLDLGVFYARDRGQLLPDVVLVRGSGGEEQTIPVRSDHATAMPFAMPGKRISDFLAARPLSTLPERVSVALEQHAIALRASDDRTKLLSAWTGLETLVSGARDSSDEAGKRASVIDRVASAVVPIVAWRTLDQIITYLAISVRFYAKSRRLELPSPPFEDSKKFVSPEDMMTALVAPNNSAPIVGLLEAVGEHPLLCNRVFVAWKLFNSAKAVAHKLERSSKTIGWQLRRIYRARNLLVHEGIVVPELSALAGHAELYFLLALGRVLHDLQRRPAWTIEQALAHRRMSLELLLERLRAGGGDVEAGDIIAEARRPTWRPWPDAT